MTDQAKSPDGTSLALSIVIPCLNEVTYLPGCLNSLIEGDYPHSDWEILIVDGGSTDGTLDVVADYRAKYPFIRLIPNPARIKPIALNIGIKAARGDVIMRIDAHARYARDYVRRCVEGLRERGVENIGGIRETHTDSNAGALGLALSLAVSAPAAVGGAHYRTGRQVEPGLVDTVFCGCYPRHVFDEIGLFNERLIRTQDRELNFRLREAGGRVLLDPAIRCTYFSRTDFRTYLRWIFEGAFWLGYARRFTTVRMISRRNLAPPLLVGYLIALIVLLALLMRYASDGTTGLLIGASASLPLAAYFLLITHSGWRLSAEHQRPGLIATFPFVAVCTHLWYGVAVTWGVIRSFFDGRDLWTQRTSDA